jgi:S-adenosylmethionine:tRNA ribosyltransferase-isomerase
MRVDLFDFDLPVERIAQEPLEPRDAARLLHVGEALADRQLRDLPELLRAGDLLVFNNSRVIPARLFAKRGAAAIEILLHRDESAQAGVGPRVWRAFARPAKKLKPGDMLTIAEGFALEVVDKTDSGEVRLRFSGDAAQFMTALALHGHMPLPPYIKRADTEADRARYQTIYAQAEGSVAAPTAGLHFTPELLAALAARGIDHAFVTLHVGAGTFQPVKVENTHAHVMHREWAELGAETAAKIQAAKARGGRVIAVGTTSLRVLESAALGGTLGPYAQDTDIFITPGFDFRVVDLLLTNFHLPRSTLFMLVAAFSGLERMQAAYRHAIAKGYRFYSYGDACLLERAA